MKGLLPLLAGNLNPVIQKKSGPVMILAKPAFPWLLHPEMARWRLFLEFFVEFLSTWVQGDGHAVKGGFQLDVGAL